jgi:hypothetical protein
MRPSVLGSNCSGRVIEYSPASAANGAFHFGSVRAGSRAKPSHVSFAPEARYVDRNDPPH